MSAPVHGLIISGIIAVIHRAPKMSKILSAKSSLSRPALSNRTFSDDGNVLSLPCPIMQQQDRHVANDHLKCDRYNGGTEFLILF